MAFERPRGVVLVTGASSGIGRSATRLLAERNYHVLAGVRQDRDAEALRGLCDRGRIEPILLDVTSDDQVAHAAARVLELAAAGVPLRALVNNAGIAVLGPLETVAPAELSRQLETNVVGPVRLAQALIPSLVAAKGRVVSVGSVLGRVTWQFCGAYAASKYALEAISDALRLELAPFGVAVSLIEPGAVATPLWGKGAVGAGASVLPALARQRYGAALEGSLALVRRSLRFAIPPEQVAQVILWAIEARAPRARYPVGPSARAQLLLRALLPDASLDRLRLFLARPRG